MKQKKITARPHDPTPPNFGGADQPLDYSDRPVSSQSILPRGEIQDKPPLNLS